jgi:hypothetical protein
MNKFKFYFILLIATVSLFSCSKDETVTYEPPREYSVQYEADIKVIEEYLNTYYLDMDLSDPNFADKDVVITKIPVGGTQPTLMSYLNATTFPKLLTRTVNLHDVPYKLYYLVLREGVGSSPCNVDGVLTSYRGDYLESIAATTTTTALISATKFDEMKFPQSFFDLPGTITGWGETFPKFKTGTYTSNSDGTITYKDFGAGVMFIPSGLAYYNSGSGSIPSYAPLVFSFKLYEIKRLDYDRNDGSSFLSPDGIPSYLEDIDGDGYVYDFRNTIRYPTTPTTNPDDTDKDGIPDFLDVDDDGDNFTTMLELKKPDGTYHTFETVPSCSGQTVKRYLTANCKPPYID